MSSITLTLYSFYAVATSTFHVLIRPICGLSVLARTKNALYLASKRGGPREKKKKKQNVCFEEDLQQDNLEDTAILSSSGFEECMLFLSRFASFWVANASEASDMFDNIDVLSLPGAGLQRLNFSEIPSTLENLYPSDQSQPSIQTGATFASPNSTSCLIRMYGSEAERWVSSPYIEIYREPANARERLTGYYDFIHDYFPILPPRVSSSRYQPLHGPMPYSGSPSQEPLMEYRPRSPLRLAISSVLALRTPVTRNRHLQRLQLDVGLMRIHSHKLQTPL